MGGPAQKAEHTRLPISPKRRDGLLRVHFSYGVGYSQMNGLKRAMKELDHAGLGADFRYIGWVSTGPGLFQGQWRELQANHPAGHASHSLRFRDLRLDLSLTRRWTVGILFAPLGHYSISGGKEIPVGDGLEGIHLGAEFSGQARFLTLSFVPFPSGHSRTSTFQLQAGVGLNRLNYTYYNDDGAEGTSAGQDFLCLVARAEYGVFTSRHWSFNFGVSYKYAPVDIPGTFFEKNGYSFTKYLSFHWREAFPAISADMGGFGCGISLGFHL